MSAVPGADVPMEPTTTGKKKRERKGRVGKDKQEAVMNRAAVNDKADYLVGLYRTSTDAANDFSEAIKAVSEKAGMNASAVRRFIVAKAGENYAEAKRTVTQLSLLFDIE